MWKYCALPCFHSVNMELKTIESKVQVNLYVRTMAIVDTFPREWLILGFDVTPKSQLPAFAISSLYVRPIGNLDAYPVIDSIGDFRICFQSTICMTYLARIWIMIVEDLYCIFKSIAEGRKVKIVDQLKIRIWVVWKNSNVLKTSGHFVRFTGVLVNLMVWALKFTLKRFAVLRCFFFENVYQPQFWFILNCFLENSRLLSYLYIENYRKCLAIENVFYITIYYVGIY